MVQVKKYHLPPTPLIPNSPYPLLHYQGFFPSSSSSSSSSSSQPPPNRLARLYHELFTRHGWETQWIFRYGPTQSSHYHSLTHECMAVLCGEATIRFGVADDDEDSEEAGGFKGIEVQAKQGDVFVIPSGVAHKTFDVRPGGYEFKLLTPGDGHGVSVSVTGEKENGKEMEKGKEKDERIGEVLEALEIDGFAMLGAYSCGGVWDFAVGGEIGVERYEEVWGVPKPGMDPVLGMSGEGLGGSWVREGVRSVL